MNKRITLRILSTLLNVIDRIAKEKGQSRNAVVIDILWDYAKEYSA